MSTATEITATVLQEFRSNNRNIFGLLKNNMADVERRTSAAAALDPEVRAELTMFCEHIDQENSYARKVSQKDLHEAIYRSMAKAFLKVLASGVLVYATKATEESEIEMQELKWISGWEPRPAAKPVAPVLSPAEAFDAQIRDDWAHLPMDKIKAKKNASAAYRKRLAELLDSGAIESQITKLHDINEVGG
jgi:hypothetical protein